MNLDEGLDGVAKICFDFFNAWVKAGFTEDQASRMVILMMVEMQKGQTYRMELD